MRIALIALALVAGAASAQVTVSDAWIRATVPAQKATGAFMKISAAKNVRLIEVRTPDAGSAEFHQMAMEGQVMRMRQVDGVDLPAGTPVVLSTGGQHVMLVDLKHQLKAGDVVPLTLVVQGKDNKHETITLNVPVKPLNYSAPR